jgi:hypothetical protein
MENLNTEKKTSLLITKKNLGQSALKTETSAIVEKDFSNEWREREREAI